jgi:drug/metabolite transporter (DMT)-like permease
VGYSLWYAALPRLGAARAAVLQLLVPVLTALTGVALLNEPLSLRLIACGVTIIGGVALFLRARS